MQYYLHESNADFENQIFCGNLSAWELHPDGRPRHTFRTYTVLADGDHVTFRNCLFQNNAGLQKEKGQAIALYLDGNDIHLDGCKILGHQDTLFLAPLPPREVEPDGFLGPRQFAPRKRNTMYFTNCLIQGGVDFIFGGAEAYFENCEFRNVESGYVFAPCTPQDAGTGFVARHCRFTCTDDIEPESCYIARPWREFGKVRLENCYLGPHIHREGWHDWGKTAARETVVFEEYDSFGPGWDPEGRPSYIRTLRQIPGRKQEIH